MLNMICSVDGASVLDGVSGGLGGAADHAVFSVIRTLADVILVGAATVRAEGYGPPKKPGQHIAVVTRSGVLDWSSALFTSGAGLAVLPEDGPTVPVASVRAGHGDVDLSAALALLDAEVVLVEGGPTLNGQLLSAGLVDELCVTFAPKLVGGAAKRIVVGPSAPTDLSLVSVLEDEGFLLCRYVRS
jgi:riboflavin biosynthesis pyrimidine reductase